MQKHSSRNNGQFMVLNFWACVLALLRCVVCAPTQGRPMKVDDLDAAIARARLALSKVSVPMLGQEHGCKNIAVEQMENTSHRPSTQPTSRPIWSLLFPERPAVFPDTGLDRIRWGAPLGSICLGQCLSWAVSVLGGICPGQYLSWAVSVLGSICPGQY